MARGVELRRLVPELESFAGAEASWSIRLRRPLLELTSADCGLVRRELAALRPQSLERVRGPYTRWWDGRVTAEPA